VILTSDVVERRVTVDDSVTSSTNHGAETPARVAETPPCAIDPARRLSESVFNGGGDGDDYGEVTPAPVEANVVLVSRPGDLPPSTSCMADERVSLGNRDASNARRLIVGQQHDDSSTNSVSQPITARAVRRPRKRSSLCNNVDDVQPIDEQPLDTLTAGVRKTSVPHQRHAVTDTHAADREHRPKRKGTVQSMISDVVAAWGAGDGQLLRS